MKTSIPAHHIIALGSPWTDASGIALVAGSEEVRDLAVTSCSAEMAMEPLRKIIGRIHDFHAEIAGIHPALLPVQTHMQTAIAAIKEAEACYEQWRTRTR